MPSEVKIAPVSRALPSFLSSKNYSQLIVLADTATKRFCYPVLKSFLPKHMLVVVPNGEDHKNLATCQVIWEKLTTAKADRDALVLNLGGGVVGDMGGFCAATYKRGVDFVQVPTTLLAQVDASIGGKLGVDFHGLKNQIGVFREPAAVLVDDVFLRTLPERELRSGFAEIIKHCLIADADKWREISRKDFSSQDFADLTRHSIEIKRKVVENDPQETGLRKILNFGHTLGHALETFFMEFPKRRQLLHGEAVAAGMIMESYLAYELGLLAADERNAIEEFIFSTYGKVPLKAGAAAPLIALTKQDKKNRGGLTNFSLIGPIGHCGFDIPLTDKHIARAISYYEGEG